MELESSMAQFAVNTPIVRVGLFCILLYFTAFRGISSNYTAFYRVYRVLTYSLRSTVRGWKNRRRIYHISPHLTAFSGIYDNGTAFCCAHRLLPTFCRILLPSDVFTTSYRTMLKSSKATFVAFLGIYATRQWRSSCPVLQYLRQWFWDWLVLL